MGKTTTLVCIRLLARNYWTFLWQVIQTVTAPKWQWDQLKSPDTKQVWQLSFTSDPPQMLWLVSMYLSRVMRRSRKWLRSLGDILPLSSREGERPANTKGSLTPSHCLFLVITSTTIESMGQGEARTLVRGGCLRNNKQMFFDDNCSEGKRTAESMLVKCSLVEAVPPASAPSEAQWWYVV